MNWNELANVKVGDVEAPKAIPDGHYVGIITGAGKTANVGENQTLKIEYPVTLQEPLDDVDMEAFEASSGFKPNGYSVGWWLTPDALYRFTDFGKAIGTSDEASVPEMAEEIARCGEPIVFHVTSGLTSKGRPFTNLDDPIPLSKFNELQQAA